MHLKETKVTKYKRVRNQRKIISYQYAYNNQVKKLTSVQCNSTENIKLYTHHSITLVPFRHYLHNPIIPPMHLQFILGKNQEFLYISPQNLFPVNYTPSHLNQN